MALITPIRSDAHPDQGLPQPQPPAGAPPHPDHTLPGDLPHPEHPIYFPLPPDAPVDPDYGVPVDPAHPDHSLPGPQPHPEHPIVLPPDSGGWKPVFIWGGPGSLPTAPHPDHDLPIPVPPPVDLPDNGGHVDFKPIWTPENGWQVIGIVIPGGEHVTPSSGAGQSRRRR
jgi:hypothetical protein